MHIANLLAPEIYTDKPNYQPGETVLIFGSGFSPNELITLQVVHLDDTAEAGEGHEPWTVMADEFGNFTSTWFVDPDDSAGEVFRLTAVGNSSGRLCESGYLCQWTNDCSGAMYRRQLGERKS
jgi:hypothetical protein